MSCDLEKENTEIDVSSQASHKKTSTRRFLKVLSLSFGSLGAVYGDIGTSPMYVMDSIKIPRGDANKENIYGCVSIIFWLFILLVFFKYTLIVLQIGPNEGEGGQIAIYAKIARSLHFGPKGVRIPGAHETSDLDMLKRTDTLMSSNEENSWRDNPKLVKFISFLCLTLAFLGCSLVLSDGLLTPTTTALTAVSGIQVAVPKFTAVVGVSEAVLIVLFAMQHLGSTTISLLFAPIMFTWLLCMAVSGIINIVKYDPSIFKALSPYYAIQLLRGVGIDAFGGAMLSITGTEAMFADVGHFGKLPIQCGITFTMVCLVLCYLGQGAYLVKNPNELNNVFYASIPGGIGNGFYWFIFVLAILSTIVASQALILGVLSIISQLINLDCFPKLHVKRFSKEHKGKVFIPLANILLLAGVCACTAGFRNSNNVTSAYGLGISLDFVVTSILIAITMLFVYRINWIFIALYVCIFLPLEMCLVIANCKKVPHGAWFPLMMCAIFMCFLSFWRYCRDLTVTKQQKSRVRIRQLFPEFSGQVLDDDELIQHRPTQVSITDGTSNCYPLASSSTPGVAIIFSESQSMDLSSPNTFPAVYAMLVRNFMSVPSTVIFCSLKSTSLPVIPNEDKILVTQTKVAGHYKAVARFGFTEPVMFDQQLIDSMLQQVDGVIKDDPIMYIFEKNEVRNRLLGSSPSIFKRIGHHLRKFMIEAIFSPINAVYQNDDRVIGTEPTNKLFIGGILHI